jgi:signal transduction histidine kinase
MGRRLPVRAVTGQWRGRGSHSRVRPVRRLSGQLALLACVTVAPVLAGLVVLSVLMVLSDGAVVLVSAIAVGSAILAVLGARVFSRALVADLEAVSSGLEAVGAGERSLRIATSGANDELATVARAVNAMIERLALEEGARDDSEQARRLLAAAVGDDVVDDGQRRIYLDRMRTQIDALGALIDDLFELSRLEAGDISWALEQVSLDALLDETVEAMRVLAEQRGIEVSVRLPERLARARGNPEKLQRVLFNLLQNAIRHTPPDGSVVVRAWSAPAAVEIEVADSGAGICAEDRERVFDPFYRGPEDAARSGDGAGLGLAVSRAIVEAHGGRIWVAESDAGTRVRFTVPVAGPDPVDVS